MNWIDPKVTLPQDGQIYLVLLEFNGSKVVLLATVGYERRYDRKTNKYEYDKVRMGWRSLYDPTRTRAATYNGEKSFDCRKFEEDHKYVERRAWHYRTFTETIPHLYPVKNSIAYIAVKDIDYPEELLKSHNNCACGK